VKHNEILLGGNAAVIALLGLYRDNVKWLEDNFQNVSIE
jgi:hypothetical protein